MNAEVRKKRPYDKCIACHVTVCVAWTIHLLCSCFFRTFVSNRLTLTQHRLFSFVLYAVRVVNGFVFVRVNVKRTPADWNDVNIHYRLSHVQMQYKKKSMTKNNLVVYNVNLPKNNKKNIPSLRFYIRSTATLCTT